MKLPDQETNGVLELKLLLRFPVLTRHRGGFQVEFCKEIGIPSWIVQSTTLPQYVDEAWQPIELHLWDPINPSTAHSLHKVIEQSPGEFSLTISYLDPAGLKVGTWLVSFDRFRVVDFGGTLSYKPSSLSDPITIMVVIDPIAVTLK